MAYEDTISSRWYTQAQAINYVGNHWDRLAPLYERDDIDAHKDEYDAIRLEMMQAGSVENCGGVNAIAAKYCISVSLAQLFVDDIKYCVRLYKENVVYGG